MSDIASTKERMDQHRWWDNKAQEWRYPESEQPTLHLRWRPSGVLEQQWEIVAQTGNGATVFTEWRPVPTVD